ncbi:hypothetical protein LX32DRAFT_647502 [Colletotrichum zoysiae]|uniref:Uncharacterized protein n=1 Tax=Colletotrichum zoysiae TaxID=1216348 RepID=A0AAD9HWK3_9PEZI|nr:hypothetical protein LX32DRAFT_647502 [Colletotrichum zoysiae]
MRSISRTEKPSIPRRPRERQGRAPGARTAYTEDIGDTLPRHAGNEVDYDDKKPVTLRTVSGKNITRQIATQNDAERWKVPAHYFLARWDPNKNPLLFLNLVFDAISLGAWMFDWVTFYEEEDLLGDKRVAATVKEFALLLEGLEDRSTSAYKDMHADFLRGYHQLLSNLQYMLKVCVGFGSLRPIAGAEDQKRADKDYAAREMLAVLFDPDMKLNETAGFMYEMKRWQFWYGFDDEPRGLSFL